jgi:hypothetical protein
MEAGTAVNTFVPLWIFAPLLLVGIVGWFITPKPSHTGRDNARSTGVDARPTVLDQRSVRT